MPNYTKESLEAAIEFAYTVTLNMVGLGAQTTTVSLQLADDLSPLKPTN